jgi:hypothetical protein
MTKPLRKSRPLSASRADLDSWLFSPEIEPELLTLLAAYRHAAESLRQTAQTSGKTTGPTAEAGSAEVGSSETIADGAGDVENSQGIPRGLPAVPRMHSVPGIDAENLAHLHGQLVANGFATVEILGRSDGLAYRVTREGLGQLAGEPATADAA